MRTAGKIGLAVAAAFGLAYGGYLVGTNSDTVIQNKPLEEAVCEDIDTDAIWEAGRKFGDLEGLKAGIREGKVTGERETKDKWFEKGRIYGESLGLDACDERRYNEGLKACDDTKYQDGMIEGEELGLEEGKRRFLGSGTEIYDRGDYITFTIKKYIFGKHSTYWVTFDKKTECIERTIFTSDDEDAHYFLSNETCNSEPSNLNVDFIQKDENRIDYIASDGSIVFRSERYSRTEDFQANQELFLWADNVMQEAARNPFEVR